MTTTVLRLALVGAAPDHWSGTAHIPAIRAIEGIARIFTIFEGTSEIQRMIIGRAVTGLAVR